MSSREMVFLLDFLADLFSVFVFVPDILKTFPTNVSLESSFIMHEIYESGVNTLCYT
jgi:hypothetical protein